MKPWHLIHIGTALQRCSPQLSQAGLSNTNFEQLELNVSYKSNEPHSSCRSERGQAIVIPLMSFLAAALRGLAFEGSSWGWALLSWASW